MRNTVLIATFGLLSLGRLTGFFTDPALRADDIHRIVGSPAAVTASVVIPERLHVVSWNIERGVRFAGVLHTLQKLDADVLLLQEVDRYCDRSGARDVAADLAAALGMNWVFAGEFQEIGEGTKDRAALHGQAILSRYPITDAGVLVFAEQARLRWRLNPVQPRRGGRMALRARTGGMLVYTAHLESGGNGNERCAASNWTRWSGISSARRGPLNVSCLREISTISPWRNRRCFGAIRAERFIDSHGATPRLTSISRSYPIDWIFVKNLAFLNSNVYMVKDVSDHFPVVASVANVQVIADQDRVARHAPSNKEELDPEPPTRLKRDMDRYFSERTARAVGDLEPCPVASRFVDSLELATEDVVEGASADSRRRQRLERAKFEL